MANAQSGRASAVGFCIESSFRSAPLTGSVSPYSIGIPATNPLRFMFVEPGGGYPVKPTKDVAETEIDGDFEVHRVVMTGKSYDGKDSWKMDPENSYYPLLGIFGRDVETALGGGAYKHVFTHNKYMPSFTQEEQFGDGSNGRLSTGVCFAGLNLVHGPVLMADATYYAHRQIPNRYPGAANVDTDYDFTNVAGLLPSQLGGDNSKTVKVTTSPTYVDVAEGNCGNGPLVFAQMAFGTAVGFSNTFVTLNDSPYAAQFLPGFNIDISRAIERFQVGGSGYDAGVPVADLFKVMGKLQILFQDNTIPANTLANCKFGICAQFIGPQIASSGFNYSYEFYLPRVKFLDADISRTDKAMVTGGNFQAEKDPSLGYSCKITIQNGFTNAALAGEHASYTGVALGGYQRS